jgi:hypothetical protein
MRAAPAPHEVHREAAHATRAQTIPDRCSASFGECLPPVAWVRKLCDGVHPDVALYLFRAGTPWQRLYMRARAKPYNASGGVSLLGESLEYGEELIALHRHDGRGDFQIGDSEGYDVLRWNGSCVTIHDGEYSTTPPRRKGHSRVEWRYLSDDLQRALSSDPGVTATVRERRRHCQGATFGMVSKACVDFDGKLVDEIVRYVRTCTSLPQPSSVF